MLFRTINQCFNSIYEQDNETAITKGFIRKLCNSKQVYYINAGKKILVDFNSLIQFLQMAK